VLVLVLAVNHPTREGRAPAADPPRDDGAK